MSRHPSAVCYHCDEPGHKKDNCPSADLPAKTPPAAPCINCHSPLHKAAQCQFVKQNAPLLPFRCYSCGLTGHKQEDCLAHSAKKK